MPLAHLLQGVEIDGVRLARDAMPYEYLNLLARNPLLAQMDGDLRVAGGWTDLDIRTAQLCVAVKALAEMQKRSILL